MIKPRWRNAIVAKLKQDGVKINIIGQRSRSIANYCIGSGGLAKRDTLSMRSIHWSQGILYKANL